MRNIYLTLILLITTTFFYAQEDNVVNVKLPTEQKYEFTPIVDIEASAVKSQGNTGTC